MANYDAMWDARHDISESMCAQALSLANSEQGDGNVPGPIQAAMLLRHYRRVLPWGHRDNMATAAQVLEAVKVDHGFLFRDWPDIEWGLVHSHEGEELLREAAKHERWWKAVRWMCKAAGTSRAAVRDELFPEEAFRHDPEDGE